MTGSSATEAPASQADDDDTTVTTPSPDAAASVPSVDDATHPPGDLSLFSSALASSAEDMYIMLGLLVMGLAMVYMCRRRSVPSKLHRDLEADEAFHATQPGQPTHLNSTAQHQHGQYGQPPSHHHHNPHSARAPHDQHGVLAPVPVRRRNVQAVTSLRPDDPIPIAVGSFGRPSSTDNTHFNHHQR